MLVLALSVAAYGQERFDAHGLPLAVNDGDLLDPVGGFRAETQVPGAFGVTGLFEYASQPLVLVRQDFDGSTSRDVLVDNLLGLHLGGFVGLHERVGVGLSLPVWFTGASVDESGALVTGGPTFGDLRLAAPVGLVLADEEEGGVAVSVVPFVDAPTGADARFLGNAGFGGGGLVAAGWTGGALGVDANVGVNARPGASYENLAGGAEALFDLAAGYAVNETLAVRGEAQLRAALAKNRVPGTETAGELLVSARGRYESGLSWTAGGSVPFTHGAGAARFRVFAGAGFTVGKGAEPDTDLDGLVDSLDACPTVAEVVNGYKDEDGCPDALASYALTVKNEDGQVVPDAKIVLGGAEYIADAAGVVHLVDRMPGTTLGGDVTHKWYADAHVADATLGEGENSGTVTLAYLPGKVRVITKTEGGAIVDATVAFQGPVAKDTAAIGDDGQEVFGLRPGAWRLLISAESFGTERRELTINPGEMSLVVIEVVMKPTKIKVVATEIKILEQVHFDFDKATIQIDSYPLLTEVANVLLQHPELKLVEVQGHTDNKGNDAYNLDLSQRRVEAVRTFLIEQGVAADRLVAKGYGETKPVTDNKTEKARALNRRVQFVILDPAAPPAPAP